MRHEGLGARLALLVGAAVIGFALVGSATARPHVRSAGAVYFYANVGNPIPGTKFTPNPPMIRPVRLIEHEDGSWLIVNLRWAGWGAKTASATGISSASSCNPNCAQGKRTHDAARLVVSQPKPFRGRTVYTCFQLTIRARPAANQHYCLGRSGSLYTYQPAAGSTVTMDNFLSTDKKIWCSISNVPGDRIAGCYTGYPNLTGTPDTNINEHSARLSASGQLQLCDWDGQEPHAECFQNWGFGAPVLKAGYIDLIHQYRCTSTASSVTCKVNTGSGKGNGFRITASGVTKLTP